MLAALSIVFPNYLAVTVDAEGAYLQTPRKGRPVWGKLSWELQSEEERAMTLNGQEPVVPLEKFVYGEPGAGDYWGEYLSERMQAQGWRRVATTADGGTLYEREGKFMGVYTDDGLVVGEPEIIWGYIEELKQVISLQEATPLTKMLGVAFCRIQLPQGRGMVLHQIHYIELLRERFAADSGGQPHKRRMPYVETDKNLELKPGRFAPKARKHLGGLAYLVRMTRPEATHAVNALLREVDAWTEGSDRRLEAIFGYLAQTPTLGLLWLMHDLDTPEDLVQREFADADHAGSIVSERSTSGWAVFWVSKSGRSKILLDWGSKRQTSESKSTCEAETTAANDCLQKSGLPMNEIGEELLRRTAHNAGESLDGQLELIHEIDADSARMVMSSLKSSLPYLKKYQRVSLGFLRDALGRQGRCLRRCPTDDNVADVFTKRMKSIEVFEKHRDSLGVVDFCEYEKLVHEGPKFPPKCAGTGSSAARKVLNATVAVANTGMSIAKGAGSVASTLLRNPEVREAAIKLILRRT